MGGDRRLGREATGPRSWAWPCQVGSPTGDLQGLAVCQGRGRDSECAVGGGGGRPLCQSSIDQLFSFY